MKFKNLKKTMTAILAMLSISKVPIDNGKVNFSEDQEATLNQHLGDKLTKKAIDAMNKEIQAVEEAQTSQDTIAQIENELNDLLEENGSSMEEALELHANDKKATSEDDKKIVSLVSALIEQNKSFEATINQLIKEPDDDTGEVIKNKAKNMKVLHNATHLFADGKAYNKIEGRNWNQNALRVAEGKKAVPTDFMATNGVEVQKLNDDLDLYFREDPTRINSLHRDNLGLPPFWPVRTDVDDKVADGNIVSAEISQVRKLPWLPKNKQLIQPEERQIFPVSIDIEFSGHDLQRFEQSWLSNIVQGGSQPYKISFVQYLVSELDKKARNEDRIGGVKGVYVDTPDNATVAGKAINRQNGLTHQIWKALLNEKIKVPNLGVATFENIVDYVESVVEANLKEDIKTKQNLVYYLEPKHVRWYKKRKKQLVGETTLVTEGEYTTIENYENIRMVPLRDLEGTGLHIITFDDNIEIMEKIPREKSMYKFEMLKRNIYVLGDYKFGVAFKHLGMKVKDTDPDAFKVQSVWTNGVDPFKSNFFVPVFDDTTGEIDVNYSNLAVQDGWNTDITKFNKVYPGQIIKVKGSASLANTRNVKANSDSITLAGNNDFALDTGGTLTLRVESDFTVTEIKRTTSPEVVTEEDASFSGDTVDVTAGLNQTFEGGTETLAAINGGSREGQELVITQASGALTINDVEGNINVASTALLDANGDTITFVYVDGVWEETDRTIA